MILPFCNGWKLYTDCHLLLNSAPVWCKNCQIIIQPHLLCHANHIPWIHKHLSKQLSMLGIDHFQRKCFGIKTCIDLRCVICISSKLNHSEPRKLPLRLKRGSWWLLGSHVPTYSNWCDAGWECCDIWSTLKVKRPSCSWNQKDINCNIIPWRHQLMYTYLW